MRNVTVIPASLNKYSDIPLATTAKKKMAAYARDSTDDEVQQTSYAAQCYYYERYIKSREDWEFVRCTPMKASPVVPLTSGRHLKPWCRMPWMEKSI